MAKPGYRHRGCAGIAIILAIPAAYLLGFGWIRTTAPVATPVTSGSLVVRFEPVIFQENLGIWPILYMVRYPDTGPVGGVIADRAGGAGTRTNARSPDYRITIAAKGGAATQVGCLGGYRQACHFEADLGGADLTKGVVISVIDGRNDRTVLPVRHVDFTRRTTYAFAFWIGITNVHGWMQRHADGGSALPDRDDR